MEYKIITCINQKRVIGKDNKLLYHISNDLKNFKRMTTDNVVIMGRKTFESLPLSQPLPNRINIIITSDEDYNVDEHDNVFIVHSIEDAMELCETLFSEKECYVIGGASIYQQFLDKGVVSTMFITEVNDDSDGDAFFPTFTEKNWKLFYQSYTQRQRTDELTYKFSIFKKK